MRGTLETIVGAMFAGKTSELYPWGSTRSRPHAEGRDDGNRIGKL